MMRLQLKKLIKQYNKNVAVMFTLIKRLIPLVFIFSHLVISGMIFRNVGWWQGIVTLFTPFVSDTYWTIKMWDVGDWLIMMNIIIAAIFLVGFLYNLSIEIKLHRYRKTPEFAKAVDAANMYISDYEYKSEIGAEQAPIEYFHYMEAKEFIESNKKWL